MMSTGDGQLTADAVAKEIGLVGKSVNSIELDRMSDKQLFNEIREISIFSRIAPEDKLRIINVLKQRNEIVAMTGDGVNDALALKRADIGIAMGIRGTDVARDASDIVLVDDNFASIVSGVEEGRRIYDNTKKFIKYMLSANFDEIVLILFVIMLGLPLPLLPLQILWINLITDSFPALSLATLKPESDVMKRKPSKEGILKGITKFIVVAGFLAFLGTFLIFYLYLDNVDKARTMAVTTIVFFEMFLVFNCKSKGSVFKSETNKYVWYAVLAVLLIHLAAIYTPLGGLFYFVKLGAMDWVWAGLVAFAGFLIIEGFKKVSKGGV
jgi:Ca2+-transporting ATPase